MPTAFPTDNIRRWFTESCQTISSHAIITDGNIMSMITYRRIYRRIISIGISQRVATQLPPMPYLPTDNPSVITVEISDRFILSVMFPREIFFFGARVSVCKTVGGCFFFICDGNGSYRRLLYRQTCSVGEAIGNYLTDGVNSWHRRK